MAEESGTMPCRPGMGEVRLENAKEMSSAEVKCMLKDCAW